jgi:hypothetical protein
MCLPLRSDLRRRSKHKNKQVLQCGDFTHNDKERKTKTLKFNATIRTHKQQQQTKKNEKERWRAMGRGGE